jgi:PAS domain S-box-containing protein
MSPHSLIVIQKAWNGYVENGVLDIQRIRPEVANSWQRCRNLSVDPYQDLAGSVNQLELRERLYNKQHLVKVARPFMDNLYNFVKGSGFQVVLTDEQGFLLEVLGDNDIVSRTEGVLLCPGGVWSEAVKGTNAIGTAIVEKKPVQIYAWEHFCKPHHFLTCSASPIYDPDGELVGVLDISGDYRFANAHTLGMVVAAVNAIENQLSLVRATDKLFMAYRYSNVLIENMSDGLISINNNGIVTEINSKGGELFGVNPARVKGRNVDQISNARATFQQVLSEGVDYEDREIVIEKTGKKIYSSASLLRDEAGGSIGAVAVFREMKNWQPAKRPSCHISGGHTFDDIIGESPALAAAKEWAKLAAASSSTVFINGESGTGKELFAQSIHNASPRAGRPFIAISCAALPENLIESELFGYEEGSFTGAKRGGQAGKFELSDGGTIFLDEIGDMSLNVQAKLLRVIQEKKVARIGAVNEKQVDIRIISATHKDLQAEVQSGNFRQDLYYRLNVLEIRIPALRERIEDLPALTSHLVRKLAFKLNRGEILIQDCFLKKIQSHSWPGNIRELENTIERAIIKADERGVLSGDLLDIYGPQLQKSEPVKAEIRSLRDVEKDMISDALAYYDGNIQKAASKLGIGRNTLYRKLKEYGISF